jgi:hypothetical protein
MSDDNAALILISNANEPRAVQLAYYVCRVEDRYFQPGQYVRVRNRPLKRPACGAARKPVLTRPKQ